MALGHEGLDVYRLVTGYQAREKEGSRCGKNHRPTTGTPSVSIAIPIPMAIWMDQASTPSNPFLPCARVPAVAPFPPPS